MSACRTTSPPAIRRIPATRADRCGRSPPRAVHRARELLWRVRPHQGGPVGLVERVEDEAQLQRVAGAEIPDRGLPPELVDERVRTGAALGDPVGRYAHEHVGGNAAENLAGPSAGAVLPVDPGRPERDLELAEGEPKH